METYTGIKATWNHEPDQDLDWFSGAPLGRLVFDRTYSRVKDEASGLKEDWPDTCRRVAKGNCEFVDSKYLEPDEEEQVYILILNRQMIPAGRHLWVTGIEGRQFISNCHIAGFETGFTEHCAFMFSELMKGGGVGANYSSRYLKALTPLSSVEVRFTCSPEHADYEALLPFLGDNEHFDLLSGTYIKIPDSREGWVDSLQTLLNFSSNSSSPPIIFDVSDVRAHGSPIRGFGGVSSGPLPLITLLFEVSKLLEHDYPLEITPELAMEVDHLIAGAVIAGNVRRSARMSIMHWKDRAIQWFLNCKSDHTDHWSTNISVEIDNEFFVELLDEHSWASWVYKQVIGGMLRDGEPGFFNSSLASIGERTHICSTNPCGEMCMESWENCCLGHINLAFGNSGDHDQSFKLMSRFLVRATFADYQDPKQRDVVNRNRRIGVGFFGLQEWLGIRGIPYSQYNRHGILADNLTKWYNIVRDTADIYADELGINKPIKCTTLAPTGTTAKLAGTSESMQCIYAKYYIRRVRYADNDPEVNKLIDAGIPVEKDLYTANTVVASFPCEDPIMTRIPEDLIEEQHEISIDVLLGLQALIQRYYADNAISCTINVPQNADHQTILHLDEALRKYLPHVKGTTVFPEASRPQSPIERITKEQYLAMTKANMNAGTSEILLDDCSTGACPIR